jgi:hypothetical protein
VIALTLTDNAFKDYSTIEELLDAQCGKVLWKENVLDKPISANDLSQNLVGRSFKQGSDVRCTVSVIDGPLVPD